ncbi:diguanylate cyclase [Sulfurimonas sp. MAG313]|nr:diguanylate cyclase [Sulfurimonas sp. MAG313]MDF1880939.1 diguanylate cyclase [Sulfurimonas sp. MAG313]
MKKVLIVDDDIVIIRFLKHMISHQLHFPCEGAKSMMEAKKLLKDGSQYAIALVDANLPDALEGECIDLVLDKKIPVIMMSNTMDSELHEKMIQKDILDYVNKDNINSFDYTKRLLQFVYSFAGSEVLLVDDSKTSRLQIKVSLNKLPLILHEAADGIEALEVLREHPTTQLVITDKNMPNMGGLELIQEIRKNHNINQLAVIGISASNEPMMSVEFLKNGANDFITKPFMPEEMLSRVISNLEMLYYIKLAEKSAVKDFLTGLYNRRYLYETGKKLYENAKREHLSIVVAMIDIDYFKKINDRYGHEAGDMALKYLGELFIKEFRDSDVVTRYGGEEFCIILTNTQMNHATKVMEGICSKVEDMRIEINKISFRMTLSIGLNDKMLGSFDQMIASADEKLYRAKNEGRNRVVT